MHSVEEYLKESEKAFLDISRDATWIQKSTDLIVRRIYAGGTVYWIGNGGSAADAQHLATELVAKFAQDRKPIKSVSLVSNISLITALGNDVGFDHVFHRQVEAFVGSDDVVIGISTSGQSRNVVEALTLAKRRSALTIALTGLNQCPLDEICDIVYKARSQITGVIQQVHITIGQAMCLALENEIIKREIN